MNFQALEIGTSYYRVMGIFLSCHAVYSKTVKHNTTYFVTRRPDVTFFLEKISIPTQLPKAGYRKFQGEMVLKSQKFEEKINQNWNFHRDSGAQNKSPSVGGLSRRGVGTFWNNTTPFFLVIEIYFMFSVVNFL